MDRIIYGYAFEGKLRFSAVNLRLSVEEARKRHNLSPMATAALGRALIGAALAMPWLAEREVFTIDIESKGPIGRIVAQSRGDYTIRGYVSNPLIEGEVKDGKLKVSSVIKGGTLRVIRDLGLKNPYTSQVPIKSGEIGEDLALYYAKSEHLPTAITLGVLVGKSGVMEAGGYALQVIDKSLDEKVLLELESKVKDFGSVTSHLRTGETLEDIFFQVLGENFGDYKEEKISYKCTCSREKARASLLVLSIKELEEVLKEGFAEVTCRWCGKKYIFGETEIKELLSGK